MPPTGRRAMPGQMPNTRELADERQGFTGTLSVVTEVDFTNGKVRRRTLTVQQGKIIRAGQPSGWE